ncbi:hypothetical protein [Peribacillus asahii]|uniref:hypothetical protein n=1 Tax=Peribacillus asahii TaxID=228899 RepID=UPI0038309157
MNQMETMQFNQNDLEALEKIDDIIESMELDIQRIETLFELRVSVEEELDRLAIKAKEVDAIVSSIKEEGIKMVAREKMDLYHIRFKKILGQ